MGCALSLADAMASVMRMVAAHVEDASGARGVGTDVRALIDTTRLCFRVEARGCGIDHDAMSKHEDFRALSQFAVVYVVTRRHGRIETEEGLWREGRLLRIGPSKHIFHDYGCWIVIRDFLVNVPVRRAALQRAAPHDHLVAIRRELFPVVVAHPASSFEVIDWTRTLTLFATPRACSPAAAFAATFGIPAGLLLGASHSDTPSGMRADLHVHREPEVHASTSPLQFVLINGRVAVCSAVARRIQWWTPRVVERLVKERRGPAAKRRMRLTFVLSVSCPHAAVSFEGGTVVWHDAAPALALLDALLRRLASSEGETAIATPPRAPSLLPPRRRKAAAPAPARDTGRRETKRVRREADGPAPCEGLRPLPAGLVPRAVTRPMLQSAVSIGQAGLKFVAAMCGGVLVLLDQHAADERIILERLTAEVAAGAGAGPHVRACHPPLTFCATLEEVDLIAKHAARLTRWGWAVEVRPREDRNRPRPDPAACMRCDAPPSPAEWDRCALRPEANVSVGRVPCVDGRALGVADLQDYLAQLERTGGARAMPSGIVSALASRACRSAIKFGDALDGPACAAMVEDLKRTTMPFQCAHGRPTCVPILDVQRLAKIGRKLRGGVPFRRRIDVGRIRRGAAQLPPVGAGARE